MKASFFVSMPYGQVDLGMLLCGGPERVLDQLRRIRDDVAFIVNPTPD